MLTLKGQSPSIGLMCFDLHDLQVKHILRLGITPIMKEALPEQFDVDIMTRE